MTAVNINPKQRSVDYVFGQAPIRIAVFSVCAAIGYVLSPISGLFIVGAVCVGVVAAMLIAASLRFFNFWLSWLLWAIPIPAALGVLGVMGVREGLISVFGAITVVPASSLTVAFLSLWMFRKFFLSWINHWQRS